ncbi:hypothetical protein TUBRATIS_13090 [Tubulinosema ratisbonensis]|uniref:Uncharacterized protein n=1 Tax=Tubulinosema ratisbonensis TaxID=291195 RepID=A0A437AMJ2_9MICR|nr:hypothetical protein TUBRATIS_13090 [Tubulinosema ratisbonensis]
MITFIFIAIILSTKQKYGKNHLEKAVTQNKSQIQKAEQIKINKVNGIINKEKVILLYKDALLTLTNDLCESKESKFFEIVIWSILDLSFKIYYRADLLTQRIYDKNDKFMSICTQMTYKTRKIKEPTKILKFILPYVLKRNYFKKMINKIEINYLDCTDVKKIFLKIFNKLLKNLNNLNEAFYDVEMKNYKYNTSASKKKLDEKLSIDSEGQLRILNESKDFYELDAFLKCVKSFIKTLLVQRSLIRDKKNIHHIVSNMLLKYKSTIFLLFNHGEELFRKKYLPKYKIEILIDLHLDLCYSIYVLAVKRAKEMSIRLFSIYKLYLFYINFRNPSLDLFRSKFCFNYFISSDLVNEIKVKFIERKLKYSKQNHRGDFFLLKSLYNHFNEFY